MTMKSIRYAGLLLVSFPAFASAGVFSTERLQLYPADWPTLTGMSATCAEVQGTYIDPNEMRWDREEANGSNHGGKLWAAWAVFGFSPGQVAAGHNVKSRAFSIAQQPDQSLVVDYLIESKVVASKMFPKDKLFCGPSGLTITIAEKTGEVLDKFPSSGSSVHRSTIYGLNGELFVKSSYDTRARIFAVFPQNHINTFWFRFAGPQK